MSWIELAIHRRPGRVRAVLTVRYEPREFLEHRVWSGAHKSYEVPREGPSTGTEDLVAALEAVLADLRDRLDVGEGRG